jgi:CHAT domain-containing protein
VTYLPCATLGMSLTPPSREPAPAFFVGVGDSVVPPLPRLPGARKEIIAAAEAFHGSTDVALGPAATVEFLSSVVKPGSVVHLSVHANIEGRNDHEPVFLFSDGRLTARELSLLLGESGARSVFAAGCSTGVVDVVQDLDEVVGLPARLLSQTCNLVVSSLWPLSDEATSILVSSFYAQLNAGVSGAEAMRRAVRDLRALTVNDLRTLRRQAAVRERSAPARYGAPPDDSSKTASDSGVLLKWRNWAVAKLGGRSRPYAHPLYWAALTVNGSGTLGSDAAQ